MYHISISESPFAGHLLTSKSSVPPSQDRDASSPRLLWTRKVVPSQSRNFTFGPPPIKAHPVNNAQLKPFDKRLALRKMKLVTKSAIPRSAAHFTLSGKIAQLHFFAVQIQNLDLELSPTSTSQLSQFPSQTSQLLMAARSSSRKGGTTFAKPV